MAADREPDLRALARELAALRMQLMEVGLRGRSDESDIAHLGGDIERLAGDLRRLAALPKVPPTRR